MLRPKPTRSATVPLEAMRAGFDAGAVQVVFLSLRGVPDAPAGILTADEEARADRLVVPAVRRGFVAGRWLLRSVLGAIAVDEPRSLRLQVGGHGKLFLAGSEQNAPGFNLSHSGDLAAVALVRGGRVGIDIEAERPLTDAALLARRILGAREQRRYDALPESARGAALLTAWTRKEAVLKGVGTGVSGNLRSIEVWPDATAGADAVVQTAGPLATWSLRTLSMPPGFHGALAVEGAARGLATWQAVAGP